MAQPPAAAKRVKRTKPEQSVERTATLTGCDNFVLDRPYQPSLKFVRDEPTRVSAEVAERLRSAVDAAGNPIFTVS